MRQLHKSRIVGRLAKFLIPSASSIFSTLHMNELIRYTEIGASLVQGKGAGSGWNIQAEVRAAAECVRRKDPVLLDIGANYGAWALAMTRLFPHTGRLVLFEPQPRCLARLEELTLPGKLIVPCAVTDHSGSRDFYVGPEGWAAASFYKRNETFFSDKHQRLTTVPVTTIDTVMLREGIEFVDFAKFDIEGAELSAFHGAERAFSKRAIGALSMEFGSGNINSRTFFRDFWDFLTGHGFRIFRVLPSGRCLNLNYYYEDLEYFRGASNYIACLGS